MTQYITEESKMNLADYINREFGIGLDHSVEVVGNINRLYIAYIRGGLDHNVAMNKAIMKFVRAIQSCLKNEYVGRKVAYHMWTILRGGKI